MSFKPGDKVTTSSDCNSARAGEVYTVSETGGIGKDPAYECSCTEKWKLTTAQSNGGTMIYQVAVESVKLATATTPEKKTILFGPETVEATSDKEAILLAASKHAEDISKAGADRYEVSVKQF